MDKAEDRAGLVNFLFHTVDRRGVEPHHPASHLTNMKTGISIVTNVADPVRSKAFRIDPQYVLANKSAPKRKARGR